eukprot:6869761-Prymnesium_polylepis.1
MSLRTCASRAAVDSLYNAVYHCVGGETILERSDATIALGNSIRSLFLHSTLREPTSEPGAHNPWLTPDFEHELARATAGASPTAAATAEEAIRAIRDGIFHAEHGTLLWPAPMSAEMSKRGTVVLNKWMGLSADGERRMRGFRTPRARAEPRLQLTAHPRRPPHTRTVAICVSSRAPPLPRAHAPCRTGPFISPPAEPLTAEAQQALARFCIVEH